ncbi:MAG: ISKra4 family transposase [Anaerolineae bacterium]|nr:ISKra4 family transposase [Anaerolineae bacterium]
MKIKVQIVIEHEALDEPLVEEIVCLCRGDLLPETMGMTLAEGKDLLANMQAAMVKHQAQDYVDQQRQCPDCGKRRGTKGQHEIVWRSLFGKLRLKSPRLYNCACQPHTTKSFSPLTVLLPERSAPELLYLETKWASLMSYGLTTDLLADTLPMETSTQAIILNTQQVAQRMEDALGEEEVVYIDGCPRDWAALPRPDGRITVGLDGGYVHAREGDNRKAGWFEVIAGKSITWDGEAKSFGFVHQYDEKPKRRLYEVLQSQGLQMNQDITFLSDGGDTVRDLQFYLSPWSEHVLDWFHITMKLTVMRNMAKGLPNHPFLEDIYDDLERVKWYLWHGNVYRALELVDLIEDHLDICESKHRAVRKLLTKIQEFGQYIANNQAFIPNYGERYRYGECISTAFAESTINWVVSKRMVKKQQMRWTKRGAHLLIQARTKTLNGELRDTFCDWYPEMARTVAHLPLAV